jgi:hypothetical protein
LKQNNAEVASSAAAIIRTTTDRHHHAPTKRGKIKVTTSLFSK